MRNEFTCDLCKAEVTENSWEDHASHLFIGSYCASQNPLGELGYGFQRAEIKFDECCQSCQRKYALAVRDFLKSVLPPAEGRKP